MKPVTTQALAQAKPKDAFSQAAAKVQAEASVMERKTFTY